MTSRNNTKSRLNGGPATLDKYNPEAELKVAIDNFETNLVTPIMPGELAGWVDQLQKAWKEAAAQIHYHAKHLHPRQFEEIAKQDPELLPRVELLKAEDTAIEEQRDKINQAVTRVAEHAPKLEPNEEKAQKYTTSLIDDAMGFVARVRKQCVAVQTWYVEAFNRDHGAVD
jgi:uncharacterized protein (DUF3084 family)